MGPDVMVVLPIVDRELPIRLILPIDPFGDPHSAEIGVVHKLDQRAHVFFNRRRVAVEVDENPVMPHTAAGGDESKLLGIKTTGFIAATRAIEVRRGNQLAIKVIGPGVVGTLKLLGGFAGFGDQRGRAVAAGVVKGVDITMGIARQDQRNPGNRDRHSIARIGNVTGEGDRDPGAGEVSLLLEAKEFFTGIGGSRQPARVVDMSAHGCDGVAAK